MQIASNTPASFAPQKGVEFLTLGEGTKDVSMIVLMLSKNWGSGSIDRIRALTYWISSYPKGTPCFVIGCEATIPDMDVSRYRHKKRDEAVRSLCDEVLSRSRSIGVRGEITYLYLTKLLGYAEDQVDIIFKSGLDDNRMRLRAFLNKNNSKMGLFENCLLNFQRSPAVLYERPIHFDDTITIQRPYITTDIGTARLNADVKIDGNCRTLWCETTDTYSEFLLSERADAFLCVVLPFAMRAGKDIICEAPVSEQFLHNLNEILVPHLCAYDGRLHRTKIMASCDSTVLASGGAVATGNSCGVDSFYTISLYTDSPYSSMNLTHMYCGNYQYGNDGPIYERAELAACDLGLPLVRTATNINEALRLPHLYTHFFKTMFGVLALRKLFRLYYYSSAEDFGHFVLKDNSVRGTATLDLLLLYVFSCADFQVITGGGKSERLEKTRAICNFAPARKLLNVCLNPHRARNCGSCRKCMRTLLGLDALNALDLFQEVFDIAEYRRTRISSFVYLVENKGNTMLSEIYEFFAQSEPLLIERAKQIVKERTKKPLAT